MHSRCVKSFKTTRGYLTSLQQHVLCNGFSRRARSVDESKGVFIATQLNWTQLTQLNSVQPSQSCFCLWRHDLQTESTVVHALNVSTTRRRVEFSWVELCRYKRDLSWHAANNGKPDRRQQDMVKTVASAKRAKGLKLSPIAHRSRLLIVGWQPA